MQQPHLLLKCYVIKGRPIRKKGRIEERREESSKEDYFLNSENRIKCENLKKKEVEKSIIDPSILYLQEMSLHTI